MLTVPAILGLLLVVYIRPHEVYSSLSGLPFLHLFVALAIVGFVLDALLGKLKLRVPTNYWWAAALLGWALVGVVATAAGGEVPARMTQLVMIFALFTVIAVGVQDIRRLSIVAGAVVGCNLIIALVGAHQSMAPTGCVALKADSGYVSAGEGRPDGRSCFERRDCYDDLKEPDHEYLCERVGLLGTSSIQGRVRYRGLLQDPNELAFALAAALPFLFVLMGRRGRLGSSMLLLAGFIVCLWCVVATRSRSGQLANLAVLGVYFVKRYRWKGIAAAVLLAVPIVLLGGRGGEAAAASTIERYEAWREGVVMFATHPVLGVGPGMFTEFHHLTAHNSHLLVAAELGFFGLVLWVSLLFFTVKIGYVGMRQSDREISAWGTAVFASAIGTFVSMMFLSLSYHLVVWVHLALAAAYYGVARDRVPDFEVAFSARHVAIAIAASALLVAGLFAVVVLKGY